MPASCLCVVRASLGVWPSDEYRSCVLPFQKAHNLTFNHPPGQLYGRAGRRCTLEDGERTLLRCIDLRPSDPEAWIMLFKNIYAQNRGREQEVPGMVQHVLRTSTLQSCQPGTQQAIDALEAIKVGLLALGKRPASSIDRFVEDATIGVPALKDNILMLKLEVFPPGC